MDSTLVLTGASSGVGLEFYNTISSKNEYSKIICISRTQPPTLRQQDEFIQCDFTSEDQLGLLGDALDLINPYPLSCIALV